MAASELLVGEELRTIFERLQTPHAKLTKDDTLVLVDVDSTLLDSWGKYNDYLLSKLEEISAQKNVKIFLFTNMDSSRVKYPQEEAHRCNVLLKLDEKKIAVDRIVTKGDLAYKHPDTSNVLKKYMRWYVKNIERHFTASIEEIIKNKEDIQRIKQRLKSLFEELDTTDEMIDVEYTKQIASTLKSLSAEVELDHQQKKCVNKDCQPSKFIEAVKIFIEMVAVVESVTQVRGKSHTAQIAGACFVDFYIPAYIAHNNKDEQERDKLILRHRALTLLDEGVSSLIAEHDPKKYRCHSKIPLIDAILQDETTGRPGRIIFFDDRRECISSVGDRLKQMIKPSESLIYHAVHLFNFACDEPIDRARIDGAIAAHQDDVSLNESARTILQRLERIIVEKIKKGKQDLKEDVPDTTSKMIAALKKMWLKINALLHAYPEQRCIVSLVEIHFRYNIDLTVLEKEHKNDLLVACRAYEEGLSKSSGDKKGDEEKIKVILEYELAQVESEESRKVREQLENVYNTLFWGIKNGRLESRNPFDVARSEIKPIALSKESPLTDKKLTSYISCVLLDLEKTIKVKVDKNNVGAISEYLEKAYAAAHNC